MVNTYHNLETVGHLCQLNCNFLVFTILYYYVCHHPLTLFLKCYVHYADRVVFVSYNILGVENATNHPDLYYKVPQEFLDWDCRKEQIRLEIAKYNPSILCFQASTTVRVSFIDFKMF